MPRRCIIIAPQKVTLLPGDPIIAGCELIEGSGIFSGKEEFAPEFVDEDGYAGENGAVVIWPEIGNDLWEYDEGESVPVGTAIIRGCVIEGGIEICAPPTFIVDDDGAIAVGGDPLARGAAAGSEDDEEKGMCVGIGVNMPSPEDDDFLSKLANLKIPELNAFNLTGFTAKITDLMAKLGAVLGKLQVEVDKIMDVAKLDPEKICTDDMKESIGKFLAVMKKLMALMPVLKKIITVIIIIQKVIKLVRTILKWTPPFVVPIIESLMKVLNIIGLVDMMVGILLQTVGRFMTILPVLQAQLMSILAMCAAEAGKEKLDKETCEELGGTWIDPQDIKDLQDMYDDMTNLSSDMLQTGEGTVVEYCTVGGILDKDECEEAGGEWKVIDVDSVDDVDLSDIAEMIADAIGEAEDCFQSPEIKKLLDEQGF